MRSALPVSSSLMTRKKRWSWPTVVVVMRAGGVEQIGTLEEVYEHPATPFVYQFLGSVNLFHGRVEGDKVHFGEFTMEVSRGAPGETLPAVASPATIASDIDHRRLGQPQFCATVAYIHAAGSVVKVELTTLDRSVCTWKCHRSAIDRCVSNGVRRYS